MRLSRIFIGFVILGVTLSSWPPSGPSTLDVLNSLEASLNDKDKNVMMALFAEDATITGSLRGWKWDTDGIAEIETGFVDEWLRSPQRTDFRDINIEGDAATFIWARVGAIFTESVLTEIEVQDGKITSIHWLDELETTQTGEE